MQSRPFTASFRKKDYNYKLTKSSLFRKMTVSVSSWIYALVRQHARLPLEGKLSKMSPRTFLTDEVCGKRFVYR